MELNELEKLAELKTSLFSYRNGYKTSKDAFIEGAQIQANEDNDKLDKMFDNGWRLGLLYGISIGMLVVALICIILL